MWERLSLLFRRNTPRVNVVSLSGAINAHVSHRGINLANTHPLLTKAFAGKPKAVCVCINSPGGSVVQSALILDQIKFLKKKFEVPVFTFAEDVAASGGYYLLLGGDEVFVHRGSIVGSVGVLSASFNFHKMLPKLAVDYHQKTTGPYKALNSPFLPPSDLGDKQTDRVLAEFLDVFVADVKKARGSKLKVDDEPSLLQGNIFIGENAVKLGLADGLYDTIDKTMQDRFGKKVVIRRIAARANPFSRLFQGAASGLADSAAHHLAIATSRFS